ncbi:MAG: c-type cytochrome [Gammaproteobacteria bacterium]|nr:c-type cytochrome [Gammaproteobacteria bacterium]
MSSISIQIRYLLTVAISCLLFTVGTSAAEDAGNLYNTNFDINAGLKYFERQCSRCHGFDAKGNDETGAPDLTGRLSRASSDVGVFNIIRTGVPGTAMLPVAADLPDSQVWQLVAYIGSLSTDPANIDLPGSVVAGSRLFRNRGDCNSCHMIDGEGGRLGPDLSRVGERRNPEELLTDILDPHQEVAPRWWTMRVTDNEGVTREGLRMNEDSFSLRIMDAESNLWSYQKRQLASIERVEESTMPSYTQTLSDSDVDDLVAYLFSLRKEN